MVKLAWIWLFLWLSCLISVTHASAGDANPIYRGCVQQCETTGCMGDECFRHCKYSSDANSTNVPWYLQKLYLQWKKENCRSDCRYHCMVAREEEREKLGKMPVKYHGKWPFRRVYGIQKPVSAALSALNLATNLHGWVSFYILSYYKLPLRPNRKAYYEYTCLWHIYGILAMNSWFWSAVFHSRDVDLTEQLDYSAAVALLGYTLIAAILRAFNVRSEAGRVMISAPFIAFVTTHILYLNIVELDYGVTHHPSRWKLWMVVVGGGLAMLLKIYDFPPYRGFVDAHALWHAATIPLTYLWWIFIRDDAEFRTSILIKKAK
ncbi:Per1-like [Dillenia turbinata]|uniref:Post-GPI attachment to proteins factor 3 n=1 Tax=Dillenia turbinata TaxID=194707 RepID=A0AAN8VF08_9MAGN